MPTALVVSQAQLEAHFAKVGAILVRAAHSSARLQLDVYWKGSPVVAGLVGSGCEFIARNRGRRVAIAPLMCLDRELWAWLGYREEWDDADKASSGRRLSFRTVALTIHFGHRNDVKKPQMFRAEWAGWARWNGNDFSFQASDAAHPHWQFDALESLLTQDSEDPASTYLRQLKEETESPRIS